MEKTPAARSLNALELQKEIAQFTQRVSKLFNAQLTNRLARETGFVKRESKLTGHLFLTIFTFGMSIYGTPSMNELAGLLNLVLPELEISREGVYERLTKEAVAFFEKMLAQSLALELPQRLCQEIQALQTHFRRIRLIDSTSFQLPPELASYFRGSGGGASEAAVKILFGYDFKTGDLFYYVSHGTTHDQRLENLFLQEFEAGDLKITDLGFFNITSFARLHNNGAFYLSRLRMDVKVYQMHEGRLVEFDLATFAQNLICEYAEIEVYLQNKDTILKTRLVVARVPEHVKAERLRKRNEHNRKKGHTTSQRVQILMGFNLYLTNVPAKILAMEEIRALYGIRWQVELVFKNWKSNFKLANVTGKRPQRIKCILYAKLLMIMITTKICFVARNYVWLTTHRELSLFQATKHLKLVAVLWLIALVQQPATASKILNNALDFMMARCLKSKSKKRVYPLVLLESLGA